MSLKQKAIKGVKWTSISTISIVILQVLQLIVLGRIFDSTVFGLMGMVLVVIGFADMFVDMGISNAIIQSQQISKKELSSLYWLNILSGALIAILIWISAPLIVHLFREPRLSNLINLTALMFIITPIGQQYRALLQKELKFNLIAVVEVLSTFLGVVFSIILGYLGFGVMSLVLGQLIIVTFRTLLLLVNGRKYYRPQRHFKLSDTKPFLSFGLYQMGESTINYFNTKIDSIMLGRLLGPTALGYYTMANNIIILPSTKINPIITRVTFPIFSKIQNDSERLKEGFLQLLKLVSFINFPIFFGLFITAHLFIPVIFGEKWIESVRLLQILCGVGLLRSIGNPIGSLLMATGKVKISFQFNVIKLFTQIPGIIFAAYTWGLIGVAITYLILQIFYTGLSYFYLIRKVLGPCFYLYIKTFTFSLISSLIMLITIWISEKLLHSISNVYLLIIEIIIGIVVYIICTLKSKDKVIVKLRRMVVDKIPFLKANMFHT
ncbi:MOP flippase family protein [Neobacillus mesonae]|uniref:MOP flippase family protein n=1 Tax=Neobacillus mesonae TaxID=1193713 RepID=UPI00203EF8A8|nr:MOP flippase family protein [Neobacillus mesonae]MCM3569378.1 MOP flippase family protein [Neobacillus mesonae]